MIKTADRHAKEYQVHQSRVKTLQKYTNTNKKSTFADKVSQMKSPPNLETSVGDKTLEEDKE